MAIRMHVPSAEVPPLERAGKAQRVAAAILAYLVEHREAKDSLEGIRQWWIDEPDKCSDEDLHQAVQTLVEYHLLCVWEPSPGSFIFGPSEKFLDAPEAVFRDFESGRLDEER
ncbi:MAG TPA: hypothetical protein VKF84_18125 [Candidatus Sulfotelmatobacter sp.]|nr:hypothetical protein [Candidatus Sulfotelmatobacter sp.]